MSHRSGYDLTSILLVTSSQKRFSHPIQSNCYRAPEVILGDLDLQIYRTLVPWNIFFHPPYFPVLFDGADPAHGGEYASRGHLSQIIGLLDSPPKDLLDWQEALKVAFASTPTVRVMFRPSTTSLE